MLLGGLWHGANWTFLAWGGMHGIALCVHKMCKRYFNTKYFPLSASSTKIFDFFCYLLANIFTNVFVCFCWIFFRADNFSKAIIIIERIITWQKGIIQIYVWVIVSIIVMLSAEIITILKEHKDNSKELNGFYIILDLSKFRNLVVFFLVIGLVFGLAFVGANPFIYFQF
jgi:alginate O-acetyltransferase complex protein AlgI